MTEPKRSVTWIGIDPGEHTGLAVWDGSAFERIETLPIHRALVLVEQYHDVARMTGNCLCVVFEDARQRTWFTKERSASEYRGRLMGAGAAKRDAKIWEEFCIDLGIPYEAHKPTAGTTKWKEDYFKRVTGWDRRTSEHARDAAVLVMGRR